MTAHLTDDQLLDQLYGGASHAHIDSCAQCSARYREVESRRAELVRPVEIAPQLLAEQHAKIVGRLDGSPAIGLRWIPALAAAAAIAIGLFVYRPGPARRTDPAPAIAADDQLYSELYSIEQSSEPRAAAPIHALFEDNQ